MHLVGLVKENKFITMQEVTNFKTVRNLIMRMRSERAPQQTAYHTYSISCKWAEAILVKQTASWMNAEI